MTLLKRLAPTVGVILLSLGLMSGFATPCLVDPATANDCQAQCQAQENACRRATKDSPSCSAEMTRCLQSCRAQR